MLTVIIAPRKGEADADGPQMALQRHFKTKRDHVLKRLHALHLDVDVPPQATFYIWLNLEKLPPPLNNGLVRRLVLGEKIISYVDSSSHTDLLRRTSEGANDRNPGHFLRHQPGAP